MPTHLRINERLKLDFVSGLLLLDKELTILYTVDVHLFQDSLGPLFLNEHFHFISSSLWTKRPTLQLRQKHSRFIISTTFSVEWRHLSH